MDKIKLAMRRWWRYNVVCWPLLMRVIWRQQTGRFFILRDMPDWFVLVLCEPPEDKHKDDPHVQEIHRLAVLEWEARMRQIKRRADANTQST